MLLGLVITVPAQYTQFNEGLYENAKTPIDVIVDGMVTDCNFVATLVLTI